MSAKGFVKGLAAGAVLAAVGALVISMKDGNNKAAAKRLGKVAHVIKDKVVAHAKKMGKLSKSAYDRIVDTTVAEYRGVQALSESELKEMRSELKAEWAAIQGIIKPRVAKK